MKTSLTNKTDIYKDNLLSYFDIKRRSAHKKEKTIDLQTKS